MRSDTIPAPMPVVKTSLVFQNRYHVSYIKKSKIARIMNGMIFNGDLGPRNPFMRLFE